VSTGPEQEAAAGRGHLRAAHADRELVIDLLKTAFVQGRLTKDELDARAGSALAARTYAQLAALTDDIPAAPRLPARPRIRPVRTHPVRTAAIRSGSCLTVGILAFWYGAHLDDQTGTLTLLWVAFYALIAAMGIMGYGIVVAVAARRSGRQPPRPGQVGPPLGGQPRGGAGDAPLPPGSRTGQTRADLRTHRSRLDRQRPCGRAVPAPRGAKPAPGAA
jgi:hypothetical protein